MATPFTAVKSWAHSLRSAATRRPGVVRAGATLALLALALARAGIVFKLTPENNEMYSESLVRFRYAEMVMRGEPLPRSDPMVQWPEGFRRDEMIMPLPDYLVGLSYRLYGGIFGAPDRYAHLRHFMAAYAAAYVPAAFLLFWVAFRRFGPAWGATALYVTCLPTFVRAAGNYLREDFATPALLVATAAAWLFLEKPPATRRNRVALTVALGLCIVYALSCWHMAQFYLNVLLGVVFVAALAARPGSYGNLGVAFLLGTAAAAVLNKPLFVKGVLWSPTVAAAAALTAWGPWRRLATPRWRLTLAASAAALVGASLLAVGSGAYGHAYALIWSKLRFAGVHPDEPTRLPIDARIFWMGPYDTASLRRAFLEYGPLLPAAAFAFLWAWSRHVRPRQSGPPALTLFPTAMTAATAALYWLLVRLTIFFAPWAALWGTLPAARARGRWKVICAALVAGLLAFQFYWAFNYARPGLVRRLLELFPAEEEPLWDYGARDNDVFLWLKEKTPEGSPVLAQFGVSASVMYWGERPVALHPMFEVPDIRTKIVRVSRAFVESEDDFYELCRRWRIAYVVYNAPVFLVYEPPGDRYFAAAPDPPASAVGMKMQFKPEELTRFRLSYETYSFRVFEVGRPYAGYAAKRYHPYFDTSLFAELPTREHYREIAGAIRRAGEHYARGLGNESVERWSAAAAQYGLALSLHPDYEDAEMRLGYCLAQMRRYREAEPHFRRAVAVDPNNAQAHTYMGSYYLSVGAYAAALAEYRRAHELAPDDPQNLERIRLLKKIMAGS
ncbi:MAG: tetratricopeptide repeat protein [candidate division Zixibacteria bacterium]|nr:tetratricopeptide repeat protein [candidate division Zixibacteria bacterium]